MATFLNIPIDPKLKAQLKVEAAQAGKALKVYANEILKARKKAA